MLGEIEGDVLGLRDGEREADGEMLVLNEGERL